MGMNRRAEWAAWHAEPDPSSLPAPKAPPAPQEKFRATAVGWDSRGVPLVDNRSGLGLGLGRDQGEKESLLAFRQAQQRAMLRYDPSVARFVTGQGAASQRAAPLYNSTRMHSQAWRAARHLQLDDAAMGAQPVARARRLVVGSVSERPHLFPRHPDDDRPLTLRQSGGQQRPTSWDTSAALANADLRAALNYPTRTR